MSLVVPSRNKIGGCICIIIAVIVWVTMSEIIPFLDSEWQHGFFIRFFVNLFYSQFLIIWYIAKYYFTKMNKNLNKNQVRETIDYSTNINANIFGKAILVNFILILGGYAWYISLSYTEASINNTIYQSNVAMVYILSVIFTNTKLTFRKSISVICSISGVILISFMNESSKEENKTTSLYAIYQVTFGYITKKYFNPNSLKLDTILFTGLLGVSTFLTCWPIFIVFNITGIETFELPPNKKDWLAVIITTLIDQLFQISLFIGVSLTNPVFMSMGILFAIPLSVLTDILFHGLKLTLFDIIGGCLIIFGFILMQLDINSIFTRYKNNTKLLINEQEKHKYGSVNIVYKN